MSNNPNQPITQHPLTLSHTHTHPLTLSHTHTHTLTLSLTHTHSHTHLHSLTHTHKHTQLGISLFPCCALVSGGGGVCMPACVRCSDHEWYPSWSPDWSLWDPSPTVVRRRGEGVEGRDREIEKRLLVLFFQSVNHSSHPSRP